MRLVRTRSLSEITLKRILLFTKSVEQHVQLPYFIHAGGHVRHRRPIQYIYSGSTVCVFGRKSSSRCKVASIKTLISNLSRDPMRNYFSILLSIVQQRFSSHAGSKQSVLSVLIHLQGIQPYLLSAIAQNCIRNCMLFKSSGCLMPGETEGVTTNQH